MVQGGGLNFFKVDENGMRSEIFARKGGGGCKAKWGGGVTILY